MFGFCKVVSVCCFDVVLVGVGSVCTVGVGGVFLVLVWVWLLVWGVW